MLDMINIEKALLIDGWMSPTELKWLGGIAAKSNEIIEVGCYKGRSTRALADNTNGLIICVDPFYGPYFSDDFSHMIFDANPTLMKTFMTNVGDHIHSGKVTLFQNTLEKIPHEIFGDFIFIDGDHHYDKVITDIREALIRIKQNGTIAGHDYGDPMWPGVERAVNEVFGKVNVIDTIWWVNV